VILTIANNAQIDQWFREHNHNTLVGIKGPAPAGSTYSDGTPIVRPVNVGWLDTVTGEECPIEYVAARGAQPGGGDHG
jgi:hypothetical protein